MEETQTIVEQTTTTWDDLENYRERFNTLLLSQLTNVLNIIKSNFPEERLDIKGDIINQDIFQIIKNYCLSPETYTNTSKIIEAFEHLISFIDINKDVPMNDKELFRIRSAFYSAANHYNIDTIAHICIHFPHTKVTNETNSFVYVDDMYCRFNIKINGVLSSYPEYIKATYSEEMFLSGYVHSHMQKLCDSLNVNSWRQACYGSGPLKSIISLLRDYNTVDDAYWMQFCYELPRFLSRESLEGGPYMGMSHIYDTTQSTRPITYIPLSFRQETNLFNALNETEYSILTYLLKNNMIKFSYSNGKYKIGMTPFEYLKTITEAIHCMWKEDNKKYFKQESWDVFKHTYLSEYIINNNGVLMSKTDRHERNLREINNLNGTVLLTFKGEEVKLNITSNINKSRRKLWLINMYTAEDIHRVIDYLINSCYGKPIYRDAKRNWASRIPRVKTLPE